MQLIHNLYNCLCDKAQTTKVTCLCIGLKYTAVTTDDGGIGLAFTYPNDHCCGSKRSGYTDYEGMAAIELLEKINQPSPFQKSVGLAVVNALNYRNASQLPDDATDIGWMDKFDIGSGTRVAMVGFIRPLVKKIREKGALVEVIDELKGVGEKSAFYETLKTQTDVLILTSTSILNESTEDLLSQIRPETKALMIGPTTPMVPEAFRHLPVQLLAGTIPVDQNAVLKAIRHGEGTPVIHRFSRKVVCDLSFH